MTEVFHAEMLAYSYPPHSHDVWTILMVDDGVVRYDLDRRSSFAERGSVNVLPPDVVHDGSPVGSGFRKRVLYLDSLWLDNTLIGSAVDHSVIADQQLRAAVHAAHAALERRDDLDAEMRIAFAVERIVQHLRPADVASTAPAASAAVALRQFLDDRPFDSATLHDAAAHVGRSVTHLARSFTSAFGISPHAYVTGRRVDAARRLLLDGMPAATVAVAVGFHDQAHLTRHFRRHTSTTPARFAASGPSADITV